MEKKIIRAYITIFEERIYNIELRACQLSTKENAQLRDKLLHSGYGDVVFMNIDADSFEAEIKNATYDSIRELEKEGWSF